MTLFFRTFECLLIAFLFIEIETFFCSKAKSFIKDKGEGIVIEIIDALDWYQDKVAFKRSFLTQKEQLINSRVEGFRLLISSCPGSTQSD